MTPPLAAVALAACGDRPSDGSSPAAAPVETNLAAEAGGPETSTTGTSSNADAIVAAFSSGTTLDGMAFDGAQLDGVDTVAWFWAPWCTICRAEAPDIAETATRYADEVRFVGVAGRGELDEMAAFVEETGTDALTHVADLDGTIWSAFGVFGQPAYAFIDDDGTVDVFVGTLGEDALIERVDALVAS